MMEYSLSISELLVAVLTLVGAGLGYQIKTQHEELRMVRSQLSERKYQMYSEIFQLFFDLMKDQKGLTKPQKQQVMVSKMMDVKRDMVIYAPDHIFKQYNLWYRHISGVNASDTAESLRIYLDLFVMIRKDMGHSKTTIDKDDILRLITQKDTDFNQMKIEMNGKGN